MTAQNKITTLAAWLAVVVIAGFCFVLQLNNQAVPTDLSFALATALGVAGGVTIPHITGTQVESGAELIAAHATSVSDVLDRVLAVLNPGAPAAGPSAPAVAVSAPSGPVQDTPTHAP